MIILLFMHTWVVFRSIIHEIVRVSEYIYIYAFFHIFVINFIIFHVELRCRIHLKWFQVCRYPGCHFLLPDSIIYKIPQLYIYNHSITVQNYQKWKNEGVCACCRWNIHECTTSPTVNKNAKWIEMPYLKRQSTRLVYFIRGVFHSLTRIFSWGKFIFFHQI